MLLLRCKLIHLQQKEEKEASKTNTHRNNSIFNYTNLSIVLLSCYRCTLTSIALECELHEIAVIFSENSLSLQTFLLYPVTIYSNESTSCSSFCMEMYGLKNLCGYHINCNKRDIHPQLNLPTMSGSENFSGGKKNN